MFKIEKLLIIILTSCATFLTFLIGGWHLMLTVLVVVMALDYITGIIKAIVTRSLRSQIGFKGILRKGTIMLVIILANMLDTLSGTGLPVFRTMVIFFYVGNECLSIIENLRIIGVPLPDGLVKFIEQLSKEGSNNNVKDDRNE